MPRVFEQKAGKDYPDQGIKKGDTYYKWSFRYGGTHKSLKRPRPSQLTQSKHSTVYACLENIEDMVADSECTLADFVDCLESSADDVRGVGEEYTEADEAMGGHQGVNSERAEACEELSERMQELAQEFSEVSCGPNGDYADTNEALDAFKNECASLEYNEI